MAEVTPLNSFTDSFDAYWSFMLPFIMTTLEKNNPVRKDWFSSMEYNTPSFIHTVFSAMKSQKEKKRIVSKITLFACLNPQHQIL